MPLYDNEIRVELTAPADPSADTEITVAAPDSKPNNLPPDPGGSTAPLVLMDGWYGYTQSERITYTGRQDNGDGTYTLTGVTWAQEGTSSPTSWPAGTFAVQDIPASWYEDREQADSGPVTASDIDSEEANAAEVIKADGNGAASWGPVGWTEIANKPSTFPPEAHGHDWTEITNKPATFPPDPHDHEVDALSATGVTSGHVPVAQGDDTIAWEAQSGGGGTVTAADIDSETASDGDVLTADGAGGAAWEASSGGGGGSSPLSINDQTGTEYTLAQSDAYGLVRMDNAAANKVVVPPYSSVPIEVGAPIRVRQVGAGPTAIEAGTGVTLNEPSDTGEGKAGSHGLLVPVAQDEWDIFGPILLAGYRKAIIDDAPVSYWRLGETSGTTAADEMANHPGEYNGGPTLGVAGAVAGGNTAVEFDGVDDHVVVPDSADWDVSAMSVEAWVKTTVSSNAQIMARDDSNTGDRAFQFRVNSSGGIDFIPFMTGGPVSLSSASAVNDGNWHHVVGVYDGANVFIYIDGAEDASVAETGTLDSANTQLTIGARYSGGSYTDRYTGTIDEPAFYNVALTATQVFDHYAAA